jgi:hypothetical protein
MLERKKTITKIQKEKDNVGRATDRAAAAYVYKGLDSLKLSYEQKQKLIKDLTPVVQKRIQADRSRTASRVENIAKTQEKKKMDKAKKLLG